MEDLSDYPNPYEVYGQTDNTAGTYQDSNYRNTETSYDNNYGSAESYGNQSGNYGDVRNDKYNEGYEGSEESYGNYADSYKSGDSNKDDYRDEGYSKDSGNYSDDQEQRDR